MRSCSKNALFVIQPGYPCVGEAEGLGKPQHGATVHAMNGLVLGSQVLRTKQHARLLPLPASVSGEFSKAFCPGSSHLS